MFQQSSTIALNCLYVMVSSYRKRVYSYCRLEYLADIWLSCVSISSTLARTPDNVWADVVVKVCAIGNVLARGKCKEWCLLRDQSIAVV